MQPAARTAPRGWTKRSKVDTEDFKEQRAGLRARCAFLGVIAFNHGRKGVLTGALYKMRAKFIVHGYSGRRMNPYCPPDACVL